MPSAKVKRAIEAFEKAVDARAFLGAQPPNDWLVIEHNYVKARAELERLMENL